MAWKTLSLRLCCIALVLSYVVAVFMFCGSSRSITDEPFGLLNETR